MSSADHMTLYRSLIVNKIGTNQYVLVPNFRKGNSSDIKNFGFFATKTTHFKI